MVRVCLNVERSSMVILREAFLIFTYEGTGFR